MGTARACGCGAGGGGDERRGWTWRHGRRCREFAGPMTGGSMAMMGMVLMSTLLILLAATAPGVQADTYYELLQVSTEATPKEIRRSFKKLALKLHPDKNPNDPGAHDKFVRLNTAFEVLKDPKLRKIYDQHGEEGVKEAQEGGGPHGQQGGFHSWQYYKDMSLYDDEEEVETFTQKDFWAVAVASSDMWFVNFYSPGCSHCRDLAPTWKQFAHALRGVIGIGAINCEEFWGTCQQLGIRAFPTLVLFHNDGSRIPYRQRSRDIDSLTAFVDHHLPPPPRIANFLTTSGELTRAPLSRPLVVVACLSPHATPSAECRDLSSQRGQLAAALSSVADVTIASCPGPYCRAVITEQHNEKDEDHAEGEEGVVVRVVLPTHRANVGEAERTLLPFDDMTNEFSFRSIIPVVWRAIPDVPLSDSESGGDNGHRLVSLESAVKSAPPEYSNLLKALQFRLQIPLVRINCDVADCSRYEARKLPQLLLRRSASDTDYEVYHGDPSPSLVQQWVDEASTSQVHTFTPRLFPDLIFDQTYKMVFIDFFAPWCAPCREMLPAWREASKVSQKEPGVLFGSVDCHTYGDLCQTFNIHSYPSPIAYTHGSGEPTPFNGNFMSAPELVDFVQATLHPSVVELSAGTFRQRVLDSDSGLWVVDFFAPWCGPCRDVAPEFARAAHKLRGIAHLGTVDCTREKALCRQQHIRAYPTIRLFLPGSTPRRVVAYRGRPTADWIIATIQEYLPNKVTAMTATQLEDAVAWGDSLLLVSFGAPWCRPCLEFKPIFNHIAHALSSHPDLDPDAISFGSVDCQRYRFKCNQLRLPHYPIMLLFVPGEGHILIDEQNPDNVVAMVLETAREHFAAAGAASPSEHTTGHDEL